MATPPEIADQFAAHLAWMDDNAMLPGRVYRMRLDDQWTEVTITSIRHRQGPSTHEKHAARTLARSETGFCNFSAKVAVPIRATETFTLVDRITDRTVGTGTFAFALRRSANIHREAFLVDKNARASLNRQRPLVVWFTGLSGSGKSTVSKLVEKALHAAGRHTYALDGDNLRHGLCRDLGFTDADRVENIRRVGEVAKLFVDAGLIVLCSFISPFRAERRMVRSLVPEGDFVEVFVDTPIDTCIERDPKGLYAKAKAGTLKNFTGIDSPYETPEAPEIHLQTLGKTPEATATEVLDRLRALLPP